MRGMSSVTFVECSFFVPTLRDANLSDGQPHPDEAWAWLVAELYSRFDGLTMAPGTYVGSYQDSDTRQRVEDRSLRYLVAIPTDAVGQLRSLLRVACEVFQQK